MSIALTTPAGAARSDIAVISLVGLAHGTSHFFHLLLPPLFPAFIRDFGLSYSLWACACSSNLRPSAN